MFFDAPPVLVSGLFLLYRYDEYLSDLEGYGKEILLNIFPEEIALKKSS